MDRRRRLLLSGLALALALAAAGAVTAYVRGRSDDGSVAAALRTLRAAGAGRFYYLGERFDGQKLTFVRVEGAQAIFTYGDRFQVRQDPLAPFRDVLRRRRGGTGADCAAGRVRGAPASFFAQATEIYTGGAVVYLFARRDEKLPALAEALRPANAPGAPGAPLPPPRPRVRPACER